MEPGFAATLVVGSGCRDGTDRRIHAAAWHPLHPEGRLARWRGINDGQAVVGTVKAVGP